MALTPREYSLMMRGEQEHQFDEYERAAQIAIMHERAHRMKSPKASDLFKRPNETMSEQTIEDKLEQAKHDEEWLSQWNFEKKGGN